jgi:RNA polymerase sigma-70 factor, ECF subfamily
MDREITLLAAARQMDRNALTDIFEVYAPVLYKFAFRLCNNAVMADQLVGEVFDKFVQQLSAGQNPGVNLRVLLYEIAYRILLQDVRYANYFLVGGRDMQMKSERWSGSAGYDEQRILDAIKRGLTHNLTEDQRNVVLLRFVEGFSLKETAAITGKKVNNVKVIQNRAIAALRKGIDYPAAETQTITIFLRRLAQS